MGIGVLTRLVPRDLVDEVLAETGRRQKRSRLLPAHVVAMAMAVFRDGYEEVMRRLDRRAAASAGTSIPTARRP
jgi:hypothetical protein